MYTLAALLLLLVGCADSSDCNPGDFMKKCGQFSKEMQRLMQAGGPPDMNRLCCIFNEQVTCWENLGCDMRKMMEPALKQKNMMCPDYKYVVGCSEPQDKGGDSSQNRTSVWEILRSLTNRVHHLEEQAAGHHGGEHGHHQEDQHGGHHSVHHDIHHGDRHGSGHGLHDEGHLGNHHSDHYESHHDGHHGGVYGLHDEGHHGRHHSDHHDHGDEHGLHDDGHHGSHSSDHHVGGHGLHHEAHHGRHQSGHHESHHGDHHRGEHGGLHHEDKVHSKDLDEEIQSLMHETGVKLKRSGTEWWYASDFVNSTTMVRSAESSELVSAFSYEYFMLIKGHYSGTRWEVYEDDFVLSWNAGGNLLIHLIFPDGRHSELLLGDTHHHHKAQYTVVVPGGTNFAIEIESGNYVLVTDLQSPVFSTSKFNMRSTDDMVKEFPQYEAMIRRLGDMRKDDKHLPTLDKAAHDHKDHQGHNHHEDHHDSNHHDHP